MLNYTTVHATIGKTFADKLDEVIIQSGSIVYSRRNLIEEIGNANFIAAARLAKVLRRLKIYTLAQLKNTDPYSLYRAKGIGDTAVYVAMCILHANGTDVFQWWGMEAEAKKAAIAKAKRRKQEV